MAPNITSPTEKVIASRLWWVGPLAVIAAVAANAVVHAVAIPLFNISSEFFPLASLQFVFLTALGTGAGVLVFAVVARFSKRPIRTFWFIAVIALLLSFLPDFGLLAGSDRLPFAGVTPPSVGVLMFMHVVAAAVSVGILTTLTREK